MLPEQALTTVASDVSPDGQRFVMSKDQVQTTTEQNANATPASLIVVLNWFEELK
jgi:hypothetical protein